MPQAAAQERTVHGAPESLGRQRITSSRIVLCCRWVASR